MEGTLGELPHCEQNFLCARFARGTLAAMSQPYRELLDATVRHLEELKAQGTRFVPITPETLRALTETTVVSRVPQISAPITEHRTLNTEHRTSNVGLATPAPALPANPDKARAIAELRERAMVC